MNPSFSLTFWRWFLRLALSASYLSAVADRFGLWGPPGAAHVAWGSWKHFVDYVAVLNSFAPPQFIPALAVAATALEVLIPLGLLTGWRLAFFAYLSGLLALTFCVTMTLSAGFKGPLDYSVFTVCAASFYLAGTLDSKKSARPSASK